MKKSFMRITLLSSVLGIVLSQVAYADDSALLRAKLTKVDSLHSSFTQKVTDINKKPIQSGSGVFALAYPNQFYWHLTEPDESLIVADGANLWVYNPFAEEVTVMDVAQAVDASPMALLVHRDEETWSRYFVSKKKSSKALECFEIKSKTVNSSVVDVSVCFNKHQIATFSLTDEQGNFSQFTLAEQREVTKDEAKLFKFAIPDNVDIDDQRLKQIK